MPLGVELIILGDFQPYLNKELKNRQWNNLPLYVRKVIHSVVFYILVNEYTKTSKYVQKLHHGHEITSSKIKSNIKKWN